MKAYSIRCSHPTGPWLAFAGAVVISLAALIVALRHRVVRLRTPPTRTTIAPKRCDRSRRRPLNFSYTPLI